MYVSLGHAHRELSNHRIPVLANVFSEVLILTKNTQALYQIIVSCLSREHPILTGPSSREDDFFVYLC